MAKKRVTERLWRAVAPLLPEHKRSLKGGRPPVPDRACLEGVIFVLKLIFYSCAPVFDVSPLLMGQESDRSDKHSATPRCVIPLKYRSKSA